MNHDSFEEDNSSKLRQRLWGAAVLIAIAVIVLPLLLDGAGSESQFRRVERLREEPPAIVAGDGTRTIQVVPEMRLNDKVIDAPEVARPEKLVDEPVAIIVPEPGITAQVDQEVAEPTAADTRLPRTAWVVQAASFVDENDALLLRDRLRDAGYASFVRDRDANTDPFRVLVGPMIKKASAEKARKSVSALLNNDPFIMSYP